VAVINVVNIVRIGFSYISVMALTLIASIPSFGGPIWTMTVQSSVGDPIGQGTTESFSQTSGTLSTHDVLDLTGDGQVDYLTFSFTSDDASAVWDLTLGTSSFLNSNLGSLVPGTYTSAQKAPFADAGHPGLDFSLNGIAASTLTGQFTITKAAFKTTSTGFEVESFAATFEQFSEGIPAGLTGDFRFVADGGVTPPVPIPSTIYLICIGLVAWQNFKRDLK
jgi:hypothetical protein